MQLYKSGFAGWNVAHFHSKYRAELSGARSYSWLKSVLQGAGVVKACKVRGKHRIKRERMPMAGMMIHHNASTHRWVPEAVWDLVVTMDDATSEHTSRFFCAQEGTASRFHGLGQTIARYGLFASLYSDRGSHYFTMPEAGGKVDKVNLTEVGRALSQLGIDHIAAYSPEARGRSERAFQTHQGRLPQELARAGITDMSSANQYLDQVYRGAHNREFAVASNLQSTAYVPFISGNLPDILCEQHDRKVIDVAIGCACRVRCKGTLMDAFERGMRCLSNIKGALAAAVVIVITALCIFEIVLRSLFNTPTYLQEEFTGYGLALIAFLGLGRTVFDGVIIRVNLLRDRFPRRLLAKNGITHLLDSAKFSPRFSRLL